ncbi:SusC/RagA family TonB-linked outer membrane protein [Neolewinella antarctica]|uniref:Iron complex outermembrane receptor protein n=1 Tax=Neolewinella antarctica TaxID=442734 RepID=A0ABX0XB37_9BACT|nr:SusC/RagA family TonB-linked outer membrane protein [Neolewinella antarctica]NJC26181.1 iron complex outermembrane receptor protein [Neolewinella antarctica]
MKLNATHFPHRGLVLFALLLIGQLAFAQSTVTGTLTDAGSGEPLIGAYITAVGTAKGTVTDFDGTYSLDVPAGVTELDISYTGYATQRVTIGTQTTIDLALSAGETLDEVVVIGYGTVKREDATGSVETVSASQFNQGAVTSAQELVAGKVSGVQVTTDGSPGGGATIRIRGGSSLSANNDPLIIIDGVPLPTDGVNGSRNPLNLINPNDIETFTVLKDASATAIYGSRASNGVVIITTKKGKAGAGLQLSYNGKVGLGSAIRTVDVFDGPGFRDLITERFNEGSPEVGYLGEADTDWQDEILQTSLFHDHNVSASGSIKSLPYRVSVGYTNQEGVLLTDQFSRVTYGLNLNPSFFENRLQINAGIKGVNSSNHFADRGALGSAISFDPTQPVRQDNAFGNYFYTSQLNNPNPQNLAPSNPLALLEQKDDETDVFRYIANFTADYRFSFLPALRANLNLATDRSQSDGSVRIPTNAAFAFDGDSAGGTDNSFTQDKNSDLLEFYLNYAEDLTDGIRLDILGGYSWQYFFRENTFRNADVDGSDLNEGRDASENYLVSLFSRANLTIGDRLILTGTVRRDASSRFNADNRVGIFPSAAAAYKLISVENSPKGLNSLKLRVGYGVTGQQEIGDVYYPAQATYLASQPNARYRFGDRFITTLRPEGYNANLKWEETATLNLAVDFGMFNDRLNGSVEVYNRKTSDLLNFIPVPAGTNLTNFINSNLGDLEVNGFEISLQGTPYQKENSSLSVGVNFTVNSVELTRLTTTEDPSFAGVLTGGIAGGTGRTIQINSVGSAPNSFYVFEQVYDETGIPIEGVYVDRNGDGVVDDDDLYRYEQPAANSFLGFTANYELNNFDFSFAGRASFGNYVYDNNLSNRATYNQLVNSAGFVTNTLPEIREIDFDDSQFVSDYYVRDASFLRLDHITAGYRFNEVFGEGSTLRAYLTVQNPVLITDYRGIDPEVFSGIDNEIYPRARTILLGVGANF